MARELPPMIRTILDTPTITDLPTLNGMLSALGYELTPAPATQEELHDDRVWVTGHDTTFNTVGLHSGSFVRTVALRRGTILRPETGGYAEEARVLLRSIQGWANPLIFQTPMGFLIYSHERLTCDESHPVLTPLTASEISDADCVLYLVTTDGHVVKQLRMEETTNPPTRETRTVHALSHTFREVKTDNVDIRSHSMRFHPMTENTDNPAPQEHTGVFSVPPRDVMRLRYGAAILAHRADMVGGRETRIHTFTHTLYSALRHWTIGYPSLSVNTLNTMLLPNTHLDLGTVYPPEVDDQLTIPLGVVFMVPGMYAPTRLTGYSAGGGFAIPAPLAHDMRRDTYIPIFPQIIYPSREGEPMRWILCAGKHHIAYYVPSKKVRPPGEKRWHVLEQYHDTCMGDLKDFCVVMPESYDHSIIYQTVLTLRDRVNDAYSRINVMSPANSKPDGMMPLAKLRRLCEKGTYRDARARIL